MRAGLPEIFRMAAAHDVIIAENAEGQQIPPDLLE